MERLISLFLPTVRCFCVGFFPLMSGQFNLSSHIACHFDLYKDLFALGQHQRTINFIENDLSRQGIQADVLGVAESLYFLSTSGILESKNVVRRCFCGFHVVFAVLFF